MDKPEKQQPKPPHVEQNDLLMRGKLANRRHPMDRGPQMTPGNQRVPIKARKSGVQQ